MKATPAKNKLKPDIVLKDFRRDNARFADLFNGSLFHGNKILDPDMLPESDTDVSSILKFNGYIPIPNSFPACAKMTACTLLFPYVFTMVKLPGTGLVLYGICSICSRSLIH